MKKFLISLLAVSALSGCELPAAGPNVSAVDETKTATIVQVTPDIVSSLVNNETLARTKRLDVALSALSADGGSGDHVLEVGDNITLSLWTFSPWPGQSSASLGAGGPNQANLGNFQVASDGTIDLPYAHRVAVSGLTLPQAQERVSHRYAGLGILQNPAVSISRLSSEHGVIDSDQDGVIVTGEIGSPRILPWNSGGMTMARALTLAMGDGNELSNNSNQNDDSSGLHKPLASVSVSRGGTKIAELPVDVALENDIPLHQGDHLIVRKRANIHVTALGGGITKNGSYGYADTPTLAEVIASAGGLNPNTADSSKIYVFRKSVNPQTLPVLYSFNWKAADSIILAQNFPIQNSDIVYVAESPMVPITRILGIILQFGVLASVAR